ncbi:MAG: hypothetical protein HW405_473 [Candidatus Berkelbacteria bacterium]|nr:hypothetical protein [Candidatus Berkelbacteria bacterium]
MTKRKIVQLGITGAMVVVLAAAGVWALRSGRLGTKADVLVAPMNLTVTIPGVADDPVNYTYPFYTYIDAVTSKTASVDNNSPIMTMYVSSVDGSKTFRPLNTAGKDQLAVWMLRALNIPKCSQDCAQNFVDVPKSHWAYPYIQALYQQGVLGGLWRSDSTGAYYDPANTATVYQLKKMFNNLRIAPANPPGVTIPPDSSNLTRQVAAGLLAHNFHFPGEARAPSIFLQWDFPTDTNSGFDWGYEVWRQKTGETEPTLLYVQEPPEQGMEEGSDMGMFYDTSVLANSNYTFTIKIFNRDGEYGVPATVIINMPAMP